jgi:hypothetical protein
VPTTISTFPSRSRRETSSCSCLVWACRRHGARWRPRRTRTFVPLRRAAAVQLGALVDPCRRPRGVPPADATRQLPLRLVLHRRVFKMTRQPRKGPSDTWVSPDSIDREGVPAGGSGTHEQARLGGRVEGLPPVRRYGSARPGGPPRDRPRGRPFRAATEPKGRAEPEQQARRRQGGKGGESS